MFRAHSIDYVNWLKNNGLENTSIVAYISGLKSLFNLFKNNHIDQIPNLIDNPFEKIIKQESKSERKKKALNRSIDWSYIEKMKKIKPNNPKKKMYHLMVLIQAHTGLAFIEFGKEDCLEISQTIHGPALIGTRQKRKEGDYIIFLTKEVEALVKELKPILFEPYIKDRQYKERDSQRVYKSYMNYINRLSQDISFQDDKPLTSHRLRHAFGMHCMNDLKMQVHIVAKMMGDSVETVLNNYADLSTDNVVLEQKEQLEKMSFAV